MEASKEIKVLQSLKEDTYFSQVFPPNIIDEMCENIRKDFPLDCGIVIFEYSSAVQKAKEEITEYKCQLDLAQKMVEKLQKRNEDLLNTIIIFGSRDTGMATGKELIDYAITILGQREVIKRKLKYNIELTRTDKEWLSNNL